MEFRVRNLLCASKWAWGQDNPLGIPSLDGLLSKDLASTWCDLCWRGYSHWTAKQTSSKEMQTRHHRNWSWWWEPDWRVTLVDNAMETSPTSATRHKGSSSNGDSASPLSLRDSSGTHACISNASSWRAATSMSTRKVSLKVAQAYEHLWASICDSVFCEPKICVKLSQKNVSYIWAITNHKSQICDCNTQTQMRYRNAELMNYSITKYAF